MELQEVFKDYKFRNRLQSYFQAHHQIYNQKVQGTFWEELSYKAFLDVGLKPEWESGSHGKGTDIVFNGLGLSYKTGTMGYRKRDDFSYYQFSGSRLTTYETLTEKVEALINGNEDYFVFLGCEIEKQEKADYYTYTVRLLEKKQIPYERLTWDESNPNSIKGSDPDSKLSCVIQAKMSSQIWYKIPEDFLQSVLTFTVKSQKP
jgi:hypothetical protein